MIAFQNTRTLGRDRNGRRIPPFTFFPLPRLRLRRFHYSPFPPLLLLCKSLQSFSVLSPFPHSAKKRRRLIRIGGDRKGKNGRGGAFNKRCAKCLRRRQNQGCQLDILFVLFSAKKPFTFIISLLKNALKA